MKRKQAEKAAGKKPKDTDVGPVSKKRRSNPAESSESLRKSIQINEDDAPRISYSRTEEKAFPRGGGSVLTPLEHRQIQLQATKDAIFEEETGQKLPSRDIGDDNELFSAEETEQTNSRSKHQKRKSKQAPQTQNINDTKQILIEGLKYKNLSPGCIVLGQVSRISQSEITLDIPNNLTGVVTLNGISALVTTKIEAAAIDNHSDTEQDEIEDTSFLNLNNYAYVGQYLRAVVLSSKQEMRDQEDKRVKKRIELSIDPQSANRQFSVSDIVVNGMVQASVKSIEDHGLVMDLGMSEGKSTGFIAAKELPNGIQLSDISEGAVFLCMVTGLSSNRKVIKLSARTDRLGTLEGSGILRESPTINIFSPGVAVEMVISRVSRNGLVGKIMGHIDATADVVHSGARSKSQDLEHLCEIGSKVKARIIFSHAEKQEHAVKVSMLDHILSLSTAVKSIADSENPTPIHSLSSTIEDAEVVSVEPALGLFLDVGFRDSLAFAHISRISDRHIDDLPEDTGAYRLGTKHKARIIGYNSFDDLYLVSLQQSVLEQPFLHVNDVIVGETIKGTVEKIVINAAGVAGIIINIATGLNGFVPALHLSDVQSKSPEKKFRVGSTVTARVLSTDADKKQVYLTLKKSLINSNAEIWTHYSKIEEDSESLGTILNVSPSGAVIQFYHGVKAFLPRSEMYESSVSDPLESFWPGKTVSVRAISINAETDRMTVSCKPLNVKDDTHRLAFSRLKVGQLVTGKVIEKASKGVVIALEESAIHATLRLGHLSDKAFEQNEKILAKLRPNQTLHDLVIIELSDRDSKVVISKKPSLVQATKSGKLIASIDKLTNGQEVVGFVNNISKEGVFVEFANRLIALLHRNHVKSDLKGLPDFGFDKDDSIAAKVLHIDHTRQRFALTMQDEVKIEGTPKSYSNGDAKRDTTQGSETQASSGPNIGDIIEAQITSVKDTQINVSIKELGQGRIDISEAFNKFEEIQDPKRPLKSFHSKQVLPVKVLGIHDARNHRFLPISKRGSRNTVLELSARVGENQNKSLQYLEDCVVGNWYTAFVNNISDAGLWVNLSPNIRGRIERMQVSEDVSVLNDIESRYPIGSAIRVEVLRVDAMQGRLDLSALHSRNSAVATIDTISIGTILTGKITNVTDHAVFVQLSDNVSGRVPLTELVDDFDLVNLAAFEKNNIARVCVVDIDKSNKRVTLSVRPSKILSSSLPVRDKSISSLDQLSGSDLVRGFIKAITDQGLFVNISHNITAFVRVSELSDDFVKDWKSEYEVDKLVVGKVISIDTSSRKVQLSLKKSVVSDDYVPKLTFNDVKEGQMVTGRIRKVQDFGAFIVIDNSHNVSGLAHRSEVAEKRVEDVRKIYSEGDIVKAIVLKIDPEKRKISFGLKASYFSGDTDHDIDDISEEMNDIVLEADNDKSVAIDLEINSDDAGGVELIRDVKNMAHSPQNGDKQLINGKLTRVSPTLSEEADALYAGGFDWTGNIAKNPTRDSDSDSSYDEEGSTKKKKKRKAEIKIDKSADLDLRGPQSVNDFERLLLGQRNFSSLWVQYMAFHLQLGDIEEARNIAERALKEINIEESGEKLNIWVALLNLENAYGTDDTTEEIFKRACEFNNAEKVQEHAASIYIASGKHKKADELFQKMMKRKGHSANVKFWSNYATFLFDSINQPDRARQLYDRAAQSIIQKIQPQRDLRKEFAQLEFKCKNGDAERGRTLFEDLLDRFPSKWDLWDVFIDLETQQGALVNVRQLFERMASKQMKRSRRENVFDRWLKFEEKHGSTKQIDHVKAKHAAIEEP